MRFVATPACPLPALRVQHRTGTVGVGVDADGLLAVGAGVADVGEFHMPAVDARVALDDRLRVAGHVRLHPSFPRLLAGAGQHQICGPSARGLQFKDCFAPTCLAALFTWAVNIGLRWGHHAAFFIVGYPRCVDVDRPCPVLLDVRRYGACKGLAAQQDRLEVRTEALGGFGLAFRLPVGDNRSENRKLLGAGDVGRDGVQIPCRRQGTAP